MVDSTRAFGIKTLEMVKALNDILTVTPTLASSSRVKLMERVFTPGLMEKSTTASGILASRRAMASGKE